jgi:hypothetical protein
MVNEKMAYALRLLRSFELPQLVDSELRELDVSLFATPNDTNMRTHALNIDVTIEVSSSIAYASDMFPILRQPFFQDAQVSLGKSVERRRGTLLCCYIHGFRTSKIIGAVRISCPFKPSVALPQNPSGRRIRAGRANLNTA